MFVTIEALETNVERPSPVDGEILVELVETPTLGQPVVAMANGEVLHTTKVQGLRKEEDGWSVRTLNTLYRIRFLPH